jgi:hypothetical protein
VLRFALVGRAVLGELALDYVAHRDLLARDAGAYQPAVQGVAAGAYEGFAHCGFVGTGPLAYDG